MQKKIKLETKEINEKLEYLNLDLNNIPTVLKKYEKLEYRVPKFYDEKKYRQYKYIPVQDIQILLSPSNRLDDLQEKYKKASPLIEYLDDKNEENILKYTTFLNMLKNVDIEDIKDIEKEQNNLNKKIPFKVKFHGNYLWQIYYSENTDKYFMIVPTEDTNYSTFFYLLKKKLENKKSNKIFVPISNTQYSTEYIRKSEFADLENYLWTFTKDWPLIYEVFNKKGELSIQIVGETIIYEKLKTPYKIELNTKEEANVFYKLVKALFILQTELPNYFNFKTNIDNSGRIEFYFEDIKITYEEMADFLREQYKEGIKRKKEIKKQIKKYTVKLEELKQINSMKEIEYLAKEKQISTFLECKKSFFGKVKYYFKYSKKNKKNLSEELSSEEKIYNEDIEYQDYESIEEQKKEAKKIPIKKIYTLEEIIENYRELEELETTMKNLLMDVNAIKLKNKNLQKKIENATKFIEEIDKHKKSIFEFWKYSNKDEIAVLPEGEKEEVNIIKKIERAFDYNEDLEEFGKNLDKIQRKNLSKEEANSIYIATTNVLDIINKIKTNTVTPTEIDKCLRDLKLEAKNDAEDEYDIFGRMIEDTRKVRKINNKNHRELQRDKYDILDINKNTKAIGYNLVLEEIIKNIEKALKKVVIPENLSVYKATGTKLEGKEINVFNINPEMEVIESLKNHSGKIYLYKINVIQGINGIGFTNSIFYYNENKTLPLGMDLSTKMILDISKLSLKLVNKTNLKMAQFENEKDDFSSITIRNITVVEYDINLKGKKL